MTDQAPRARPPAKTLQEMQQEILNGAQFALRTHLFKGASFNLTTNQFMETGHEKHFVVGGEPDVEGNRIPTVTTDDDPFDSRRGREHIARVRELTGNRHNAIAGSWRVSPERVDWDASGAFTDRDRAMQFGIGRGEEAVYDNEKDEDILTPLGEQKAAERAAKAKES